MPSHENMGKRLAEIDPEIAGAIDDEVARQMYGLELIASENFVDEAVLEATGSVFTNKYAEGYPGRRYYGGCEFVDIVEGLAIDRAKELFGAAHANVQAHSGSQANMAVYLSVLKPGDKILGMDLAHGGHLTHGHPLNFSGKLFEIVAYGVKREDECIDYDQIESRAQSERPKLIIAGASAYSRTIDFERIAAIARSIEAYFMVDMAHIAGLIAAGLHPSPVPHADFVTTTTHKTLRGPRGGMILCREEYAKDLDRVVMPGVQGGPLVHVVAAKAVCFKEAMGEGFRAYQRQVVENAQTLAQSLSTKGLRIVSGGTDTHLFLVDLSESGITGKEAESALEAATITVNKNAIPFDSRPPLITSGIRIGSPAVTSRGMGVDEMVRISDWISRVLADVGDRETQLAVAKEVRELAEHFPLYPGRLQPNPA